MPTNIRIYRDAEAGAVIFDPSLIGAGFLNTLHAVDNGDGTVSIYNSYKEGGFQEIAALAFGNIVREDGTPAGADAPAAVNYLNAQFVLDAGGSVEGVKPVITSPLSTEVVEGRPFHYIVEADNFPFGYGVDGALPYGLLMQPYSGHIHGSTVDVGVHNVGIFATNALGSTFATLVLTVLPAGGWVDTYSCRFMASTYRQYIEATTTAAILRSSAQTWSVSVWLYLVDAADDYDVWGTGGTNSYIRVRVLATGTVQVMFTTNNGGSAIVVTAGIVLPGSWYHLVVANDGTNTPAGISVYLDGVAQAKTTVQSNLGGPAGGTEAFRLARAAGGTNRAKYINAFVDEFSYYDTALDVVAVGTLYNGGNPPDITGVPAFADCQVYWRMGDGETFPTLTDHAAGLHDGSMINMTAGAFVSFVP